MWKMWMGGCELKGSFEDGALVEGDGLLALMDRGLV